MLNPNRTQAEEIADLLKEIDSGAHKEYSAHEFYRENFNAVDMFDRTWYSFEEAHTIKDWRTKFALGLLRCNIINLFACQNEFERTDWNHSFKCFSE